MSTLIPPRLPAIAIVVGQVETMLGSTQAGSLRSDEQAFRPVANIPAPQEYCIP